MVQNSLGSIFIIHKPCGHPNFKSGNILLLVDYLGPIGSKFKRKKYIIIVFKLPNIRFLLLCKIRNLAAVPKKSRRKTKQGYFLFANPPFSHDTCITMKLNA